MEEGFFVPLYCQPPVALPDGRLVQRCWGIGVGPQPELDLTPPGPDLADPDLTAPGADLAEPDLSTPDAQTDTGTDIEADTAEAVDEDACVEGCETCRALSEGYEDWTRYYPANAATHPEHTWQGYRYQAFISGRDHDPVGGRIKEWKFVAYSWDGFNEGACILLEAKWGYGGLLEHYYESVDGDARRRTRPLPGREALAAARYARLVSQCSEQLNRIAAYDEVGLQWHFDNFDSYIFFYMAVNANPVFLDVDIQHTPGPGG